MAIFDRLEDGILGFYGLGTNDVLDSYNPWDTGLVVSFHQILLHHKHKYWQSTCVVPSNSGAYNDRHLGCPILFNACRTGFK